MGVRKMTMVQAELDKAEDRINEKESKNARLEEELKEVGINVKSLQHSENKANDIEESYSEQLQNITAKYEDATSRAEDAERSNHKLKKDVEHLEDELETAQNKAKNLEEEMK